MKYCEDCKWMHRNSAVETAFAKCFRPKAKTPDRGISRGAGQPFRGPDFCTTERFNDGPLWVTWIMSRIDGHCGPDARFFEPKP